MAAADVAVRPPPSLLTGTRRLHGTLVLGRRSPDRDPHFQAWMAHTAGSVAGQGGAAAG